MRLFASSFAFQLRLSWRSPDALLTWVTAPLLCLAILALIERSGRTDLAAYAVVAPTLMSLWTAALFTAGELITKERVLGTLEGIVAAPASLAVLVFGRLNAVVLLGAVSFAETWLVAGLVFDRWIDVVHPVAFVGALTASVWAVAGTASILSPLFVLVPSARTIQNTLSYPFHLLGGVLVPVAFLPVWLRPVTRVIFLSWSADLLRDSLAAPPVDHLVARLLVIVALGGAGYLLGTYLLHRVLRRVRHHGTLAHT